MIFHASGNPSKGGGRQGWGDARKTGRPDSQMWRQNRSLGQDAPIISRASLGKSKLIEMLGRRLDLPDMGSIRASQPDARLESRIFR